MTKGLQKFLAFFFITIFCNFAFANSKQEDHFIKADYIFYNEDEKFAEAIGNVEIVRGNSYLKTERALVDVENKRIWVDRGLYAENQSQKLIAKSLYYDQINHKSVIYKPEIQLKNCEILKAQKLIQQDQNIGELYNASYTPCVKCINNSPLWSIEAEKTEIDFQKRKVKYHHAFFKVGEYRIIYLPYFSHSLTDSKAESGILKPEIDKGTFKIPLYYRPKPNLDLTYSPRFNKKYLIHELEYRHLIESGQYQFNGSYSRSNIFIKNNEKVTDKDKKSHRYYVNSFGNFNFDNLAFGYDIGKVSDKSYLKNFYLDHRNFIKSSVYADQFQYNGYNHFDILHFQGLRTLDSRRTDPSALPNLTIRRDYEIYEDLNLSLEENAIQYIEGSRKNITRNSLDLEVSKNYLFDSGQIITTSIHNKTDIYLVKRAYLDNKTVRNKNLMRNIPEIKTNVNIPLFTSYNDNIIIFEPQMTLIMGRKKPYKLGGYELIDSPNYDIDETNIFSNSRYSGIDYYEHGTRFSYGLNNYTMGENWKVSSFLGQLLRSQASTANSKSDYVGKINYNYSDNFEVYYRFQRKNRKFKPNRDEISAWGKYDKFAIQNIWINLRDLNQYSNIYNFWNDPDQNIIKQNNTILSYQLTEEVSLFGDLRLDFSTKNKSKVISDGIGIGYNVDCLSMSIKISNDYSSDPTRNIKKTRTYGFKIGLKTINL